jgi:hypothetical protein
MTDPLDSARDLVQRVYELLLESRTTRQRLEALPPVNAGEDAERTLYLGMATAFERGLVRTLEEALATMKQMRGAEAEAWLRRHMEGLGQ